MPYYGLYIPVKGSIATNCNNWIDLVNKNLKSGETDISKFVFEDKMEALKVLKQYKDARFKEFLSKEEAIEYAQTGFENVQNKCNDIKTLTESIEKGAFKAPTKQQLVKFRYCIEDESYNIVKEMVWKNPRYLVSSGDIPTILKEGYRYNAMHVCALGGRPGMAKLILDTVSDLKFADLLLGNKNDEKACKELCAKLMDCYLNLPEKGRLETPLHLASKYGHAEVVKILLSYPECKILRNAQHKLPNHIICERTNRLNKSEVFKHFEANYYVPVLRSKDNALPGQIGDPFPITNQPNLNCDPLSPELEIKALAGPMSENQAKIFFRCWKTPPRQGRNVSSINVNNFFVSPKAAHNSTPIKTPHQYLNNSFNSPTTIFKGRSLFNSTPTHYVYNVVNNSNGFHKSITNDSFDSKENGIHEAKEEAIQNHCPNNGETNNNNHLGNLSKSPMNRFGAGLCPRTPLLKLKNNAFINYRDPSIASPIVDSIETGREINNSLLNVSDVYDSPGLLVRHIKNSDIDKGLECIGRIMANVRDIEWCEYWDFLEKFVDITSPVGLYEFEKYLANRQKEQDERSNKLLDSKETPNLLDDVCNALENAFRLSSTADATKTPNTSTTHQITPYTYVDKSLQVHARRMTKTIIHNIDNEIALVDGLQLEFRRFKSLIYSFKEDASYVNVNFKKVHSRIGNLVSMFLDNSQEVLREKVLKILVELSEQKFEKPDDIECVCYRIYERLQHPTEQILPENIKTEEMCSKIWSKEKDCDCQFESDSRRKTSRQNRMAVINYKNHQRPEQQEVLKKDCQDNQENAKNKDELRNTKDATDGSSDEDTFWSDFGESDSDQDDVFLTPNSIPPEYTYEDSNRIFIYGNEPTKRDMDVLNAIFHIDIDKTKYPNIHSWKSAILCYTNEEMDFFPSPQIVKKSISFVATSSNQKDLFVHPQTPTSTQKSYSVVRSNTSSSILNSLRLQSPFINATATSSPILPSPTVKRLFMSPARTKSLTDISATEINRNTNNNSNWTSTKVASVKEDTKNGATQKLPVHHQLQVQRPLTPLNKLRGLFSFYRESFNQSDSSLLDSSILPFNIYDL